MIRAPRPRAPAWQSRPYRPRLGKRAYELIGMAAYADPVTLYQLQPHAHRRAKDFKYAVLYPDGREITVLTVPHYDFHWQLAYDLATPLHLPAGSKLIVTAHYDNSSNNPHLREPESEDLARHCGPDKVAYFKRENQSWDEMFSPFIQYSRDNLDPRRGAVPGSLPRLPLVQVVGCIGRGATGWTLDQGSAAAPAAVASTSAAALAASAALPMGTHRYELLGADVFAPQGRVGQAVAVKGILIPGAADGRINVTSLQSVGACRQPTRGRDRGAGRHGAVRHGAGTRGAARFHHRAASLGAGHRTRGLGGRRVFRHRQFRRRRRTRGYRVRGGTQRGNAHHDEERRSDADAAGDGAGHRSRRPPAIPTRGLHAMLVDLKEPLEAGETSR